MRYNTPFLMGVVTIAFFICVSTQNDDGNVNTNNNNNNANTNNNNNNANTNNNNNDNNNHNNNNNGGGNDNSDYWQCPNSYMGHEPAHRSCKLDCPDDGDCADYIIVGLGAGGGVVAGRFAQECQSTVFAFDMGYQILNREFVTVPRYYLYNWNEPDNWMDTLPFRTTTQTNGGNVDKNYMRGRGWGGSTTINGQVHVRGTKKNFDDWADITGDDDWNFDNVLPIFKTIENNLWHRNQWHGTKGFNTISRVLQDHDEWVDPKNFAVWDAITDLGIPYVDDIHGDPKNYAGLSYCSASVEFDENGHGTRSWVGKDLLAPAAARCSKLNIFSGSLVTKILFDGNRAIGVEYITGEGVYGIEVNQTIDIRKNALNHIRRAFAKKGVIVSGGAINTPQLLKLSGVGPKEELNDLNIPVIVDLPGVGENLQDHAEFTSNYQFNSPTQLDQLKCSYGTRGHDDPCAQPYNRYYGTNGRVGNLDWNLDSNREVECHAILSTDYPIQDFDHLPRPQDGPFPFPGIFGWLVEIMNPKSRGSITLASTDPTEPPIVNPRYLSHPDDYRKMRGCWDLVQQIMSADSLKNQLIGLFRPTPDDVQTDDQIEEYLRGIVWGHHMTSTCRMGRACDPLAALDSQLRPFGTQNLYVIDASAFPKIVSGQPTFSVYMLAQRGYYILKDFETNIKQCSSNSRKTTQRSSSSSSSSSRKQHQQQRW